MLEYTFTMKTYVFKGRVRCGDHASNPTTQKAKSGGSSRLGWAKGRPCLKTKINYKSKRAEG
jgi:hypothetical protein